MSELTPDSPDIQAETSDLEASEMLTKVRLAATISQHIRGRDWTLRQAADALGTSTTTLSNMRIGRYEKVGLASMLTWLVELERLAEIPGCLITRNHNVRLVPL